MNIASQIRHFLTFIFGLATVWLVGALSLSEAEAKTLGEAFAKLTEPLVVIAGVIAVAVTRMAIGWIGSLIGRGAGEIGEKTRGLPLWVGLIGTAAVIGGSLPSCAEYPITGSLTLRDPNSGAKGGLVFQGSARPRASLRMPIHDDEGNLLGMAEIQGGPVIEATK